MDIYEAKQVVIVYKHKNTDYIETHEIVDGKLTAGKPLMKETFKRLCKATVKTKELMKLQFDGNEIFIYNDIVVWATNPSIQTLSFKTDKKVQQWTVPVPGLIWRVENGSLTLSSFKGKIKYPIRKWYTGDILHRAPFWNTDPKGDVCMGNVKIKTQFDSLSDMKSWWEKVFFMSIFAHTRGQTSKTETIKLYHSLVGQKKFPNEELIKL
jgi:PRTRC genetic system protein B